MKTNEQLQNDVQNALKYEPMLHAAEIGVTAKDGVITLSGTVDSYAKKLEAESAVKNVAGVKAIAEDIRISFGRWGNKDDTDIAGDIVKSFKGNWEVQDEKMKVKVEDGYVTLEGEVPYNYQKEAAAKAATKVEGVKGVTNLIILKSDVHDQIEKQHIEAAIARNWAMSVDHQDISVKVVDNRVTLSGRVDSWYMKDEAERIAYNAPGVWMVDNELVIEYN